MSCWRSRFNSAPERNRLGDNNHPTASARLKTLWSNCTSPEVGSVGIRRLHSVRTVKQRSWNVWFTEPPLPSSNRFRL